MNERTTRDRELDLWREHWGRVPGLSPDFHRQLQKKIARQNRRFLLSAVLSAATFVAMLIFAVYLNHQAPWLGKGWATGLCVLVFVSVGYRVWILRGTWRAETQSIRAFLELWHRRVLARLRLLQIAIWVSVGWLVACAALTAANWATIRLNVIAHPRDWLALLLACILMQPVLWFGALWLRRRKLAELNKVTKLLQGMTD